jgi:predicted phage terminase large subunit-like protein
VNPPVAPLSTEPLAPGGPSELDLVRRLHKTGTPGVTLAEFVSWAWPIVEPAHPMVWNWSMQVICDHVQAQAEGGKFGKPWTQNQLINISPGTSKSLIVCVFTHAWIWLWNPARRRYYASANPDVALRDSGRCRDLVTSDEYLATFKPSWRLSDDQNAKGHFTNTAGGVRLCKGVGARITGQRPDDIIVDDPLDATDAYSEPVRKACNVDWWDQATGNRLADMQTGNRTIIMQRLHEDDLSGHVLEQGNWEHLCIPMEYEGGTDKAGACKCATCVRGKSFLGWRDPRKVLGELMSPERFPMSVLKGPDYPEVVGGELRRLGETGYAGQMQQRPTSAAGNLWKREHWRFWSRDGVQHLRPRGATDLPPIIIPYKTRFDKIVQSWDCSFKELSTSDRVCGGVMASLGGKRIVMPELFWEVAGFLRTIQAVRDMRKSYPAARKIGIEDKANGTAVIEVLKTEITGVEAIEPEGGKEARMAAGLPEIEAHDVYLPEGAPWLERFFDEAAAAPNGKHDDAVDMVSQGLRMLALSSDMEKAAILCGPVRALPFQVRRGAVVVGRGGVLYRGR